MKNLIKLLIELTKIGWEIYWAIKRKKEKDEKEEIFEALRDRNLARLRELILRD